MGKKSILIMYSAGKGTDTGKKANELRYHVEWFSIFYFGYEVAMAVKEYVKNIRNSDTKHTFLGNFFYGIKI